MADEEAIRTTRTTVITIEAIAIRAAEMVFVIITATVIATYAAMDAVTRSATADGRRKADETSKRRRRRRRATLDGKRIRGIATTNG